MGASAGPAWEAGAGCGIGLFGGRWIGTPHAGLGLSESGRDFRIGWRLAPASAGSGEFSLELEAVRTEYAGGDAPPEHCIMLTGSARR